MSIPACRQMGPSFESCSPNLDLSKLTNFWSRGKDAEGNWNGKDAEVATGATQIAGQTATESSYEACMRIGQASYDWAEANRPMGQVRAAPIQTVAPRDDLEVQPPQSRPPVGRRLPTTPISRPPSSWTRKL